MILEGFPAYCGGRILKGLHSPGTKFSHYDGKTGRSVFIPYTDEEIIEESLKFQKINDRDFDSDHPTPRAEQWCDKIPPTLEGFQKLLRTMIQGHDNEVGIIVAVTNPSQTQAESFLRQTGFTGNCSASKNFTRDDSNWSCSLWSASFHDDIRPIIFK